MNILLIYRRLSVEVGDEKRVRHQIEERGRVTLAHGKADQTCESRATKPDLDKRHERNFSS
jgi:hypothetical protein